MAGDLWLPPGVRERISGPPGQLSMTVRRRSHAEALRGGFGAPIPGSEDPMNPLNRPGGYNYEISREDRSKFEATLREMQSPDVVRAKSARDAVLTGMKRVPALGPLIAGGANVVMNWLGVGVRATIDIGDPNDPNGGGGTWFAEHHNELHHRGEIAVACFLASASAQAYKGSDGADYGKITVTTHRSIRSYGLSSFTVAGGLNCSNPDPEYCGVVFEGGSYSQAQACLHDGNSDGNTSRDNGISRDVLNGKGQARLCINHGARYEARMPRPSMTGEELLALNPGPGFGTPREKEVPIGPNGTRKPPFYSGYRDTQTWTWDAQGGIGPDGENSGLGPLAIGGSSQQSPRKLLLKAEDFQWVPGNNFQWNITEKLLRNFQLYPGMEDSFLDGFGKMEMEDFGFDGAKPVDMSDLTPEEMMDMIGCINDPTCNGGFTPPDPGAPIDIPTNPTPNPGDFPPNIDFPPDHPANPNFPCGGGQPPFGGVPPGGPLPGFEPPADGGFPPPGSTFPPPGGELPPPDLGGLPPELAPLPPGLPQTPIPCATINQGGGGADLIEPCLPEDPGFGGLPSPAPGDEICVKAGKEEFCGIVGPVAPDPPKAPGQPPGGGIPKPPPVFSPPTDGVFLQDKCFKKGRVTSHINVLAAMLGMSGSDAGNYVDQSCTATWAGCFKKGTRVWDAIWFLADMCGFDVCPGCGPSRPPIAPCTPQPIHWGPYHGDHNLFQFERVYTDDTAYAFVEYYRPHYPGLPGYSVVVPVPSPYSRDENAIYQVKMDRGISKDVATRMAVKKASEFSNRYLTVTVAIPFNESIKRCHQITIWQPRKGYHAAHKIEGITHDLSNRGWLSIVVASYLDPRKYPPLRGGF